MKTAKQIIAFGLTLASLAIIPAAFAEDNSSSATSGTIITTPVTAGGMPIHIEKKAIDAIHFLGILKVTAISGNTVTATDKNGVSYTIDTTNARLIRRYGADSTIEELSVNDTIRVYATRDSADSTTLTAIKIRNFSVHKFRGIVRGTVKTVNSDGLTLNNGFTINVTSSTQFKSNTSDTINSVSDFHVGDSIRSWGVKDSANKTDAADAIRLLKRKA